MPIVGQVLDVADGRVTLEVVDARDPVLALPGLDAGHERAEHVAQVADDADVDGNDLADLGGVDVDVDLLGLTGIGPDVARDAVVEAHTEGDEEVGLLDRRVDPGLAVHAHHAEVEGMRGGKRADAEKRHGDGNAGALSELADKRHRAREHDAVAGEDDRPASTVDELERRAAVGVGDRGARHTDVTGVRRRRLLVLEFARRLLRVLGDVDEHGARSS